jgi:hypothetical protein
VFASQFEGKVVSAFDRRPRQFDNRVDMRRQRRKVGPDEQARGDSPEHDDGK